jgi:ABC-2 type transport system permease protein
MWKTVFTLEWRILKRDKAAVAVLGIFAVFLILAAIAGGRHADSLKSALERAETEEASRLQERSKAIEELNRSGAPLSAKDPRDPAWMGEEGATRLLVLPPAPLAPIAVGQRDLHPQAVYVSTGVHLTAQRETETPMSGPTRLMTGAFDPTFLFVVLFPLVVIALSYELLSGERERGTLAMLLSQPVSQTQLVLGKASARAVALCVVTLLFAVAGLLIAGVDFGAPGAIQQMGLYGLVLITWALFWFAAAIAVNAWGETSANNALFLVGLWLVLVVVVPGLIHVTVDSFYPPPSKMELLHEAKEAAQDIEKELAGLKGRHDVDPKSEGFAERVVNVQEELAKRSAPVLTEIREQLAQRQEMVDSLRFLSPAIVVQLALEDVAGSGAVRHQAFEEQVNGVHEKYREFFFERIRSGDGFSQADLKAIPQLTFEEEASSSLLGRILVGVFGLLLGVGILLAIAWPGLRRVGSLAR